MTLVQPQTVELAPVAVPATSTAVQSTSATAMELLKKYWWVIVILIVIYLYYRSTKQPKKVTKRLGSVAAESVAGGSVATKSA